MREISRLIFEEYRHSSNNYDEIVRKLKTCNQTNQEM